VYSPEEARRFAAGGLLSLFIGWGDDPDAARASVTEAGRRAGFSAAAPTDPVGT
jgi:hypothetical protein